MHHLIHDGTPIRLRESVLLHDGVMRTDVMYMSSSATGAAQSLHVVLEICLHNNGSETDIHCQMGFGSGALSRRRSNPFQAT